MSMLHFAPLEAFWQLLAVRKANGRAPAILMPERATAPAAEAGGTRGNVSRRALEAMGERAGDADRDGGPAIKICALCDPHLSSAAAQDQEVHISPRSAQRRSHIDAMYTA